MLGRSPRTSASQERNCGSFGQPLHMFTTLFELLLMLLFLPSQFAFTGQAQSQGTRSHFSRARITGFRVERAGAKAGALFVSISGSETKVADRALNAWIIAHGRQLVYSGEDGAGGYENEGQSLRLYDPQNGNTR